MITVYSWHSLRQTFEARASEWALAFMTFSLGVVSFFNVDLFADFRFSNLARVADQTTWAWGFLLVGGFRLSALFINGSYWRTPQIRSIFAFLTCFVWFQLALGLLYNFSFGIALLPWLFLLDAYNSVRAGREAGVAQYIQRHAKDTNNGLSITQP